LGSSFIFLIKGLIGLSAIQVGLHLGIAFAAIFPLLIGFKFVKKSLKRNGNILL
jgi:predicted transporter